MRFSFSLLLSMGLAFPAQAQSSASDLTPFDGARLSPITLLYTTTVPTPDGPLVLHSTNVLSEVTQDGRDLWEYTMVSVNDGDLSSSELDVWDRSTLTSVYRRSEFGGTIFESEQSEDSLIVRAVNGEDETVERLALDAPVVSDGRLNQVALGTLPLAVGYKTSYRSFVRRVNSIQSHIVEVIGTETVEVPAGRFDTYVVTTQLEDGSSKATWYIARSEPRVAVQLRTNVPSGEVVVQLTRIMTEMHR